MIDFFAKDTVLATKINLSTVKKAANSRPILRARLHNLDDQLALASLLPVSEERKEIIARLKALKTICVSQVTETDRILSTYFDTNAEKSLLTDILRITSWIKENLKYDKLSAVQYVVFDAEYPWFMWEARLANFVGPDALRTDYTIRLSCQHLRNLRPKFINTWFIKQNPGIPGTLGIPYDDVVAALKDELAKKQVFGFNVIDFPLDLSKFDLYKLCPKINSVCVTNDVIEIKLDEPENKDINRLILRLNNLILNNCGRQNNKLSFAYDKESRTLRIVFVASSDVPSGILHDKLSSTFDINTEILDRIISEYGNRISIKE